jgi:hypothetical protein
MSILFNFFNFLSFSDAFKNIGDKIETRVDNAADEIGKGFNQL